MAVRLAPQRPGRVLPEAVPAERRHLRVVPPDYMSARARRRRARRLVVVAGVGIAAALFGVVAFHVVLTQSQLDLQRLQARSQAASVRQQQLRLEAARLESPERVVQDAEHLGMVPPATVRYLTPAGQAPAKPAQQPIGTTRATTPAQRSTAPTASAAKPGTTPTTAAKPAVPKTTSPKPSVSAPTATAPKVTNPATKTPPTTSATRR